MTYILYYGTDNLKELPTWHSVKKLLKHFKFIVLERNNDNIDEIIDNNKILKSNKESFIIFEKINKIELSSSQIRELIRKKKPIDMLVPEIILEDVLKVYNK